MTAAGFNQEPRGKTNEGIIYKRIIKYINILYVTIDLNNSSEKKAQLQIIIIT